MTIFAIDLAGMLVGELVAVPIIEEAEAKKCLMMGNYNQILSKNVKRTSQY